MLQGENFAWLLWLRAAATQLGTSCRLRFVIQQPAVQLMAAEWRYAGTIYAALSFDAEE